MFRDREITVQMNKKKDLKKAEGESNVEKAEDVSTFDDKAATIVAVIENLGVKLFAGVCVYILLDTRRKVMVENAKASQVYIQK